MELTCAGQLSVTVDYICAAAPDEVAPWISTQMQTLVSIHKPEQ